MATVVSLPGCPAYGETRPPPQPPTTPPQAAAFRFRPSRQSEIGLAGIAILLGMADRPARAIIAAIRLLVSAHGFPAPKTPRFRCNQRLTGAKAVHAKSVWNRDEVEIWFDGDLPPALAARSDEVSREQLRARLADRARQLAGQVA